jgi:hypothetical protein
MMKSSWIPALFLVGMAGACGSEPPMEIVMYQDAQVDVRKGPSAPLALRGAMVIAEGPDGKLAGALVPSGNGQPGLIGVGRSEGQIRLEISGRSGKIVGLGPFAGSLANPPASIRGDLTGPTAGDQGDWIIGGIIRIITGQSSAVGAACFAACSVAGGSDASCDSKCGTDHTKFTVSVSPSVF